MISLTLGDRIGGVGEQVHDCHRLRAHHHLESPRVEVIADQHCGIVTPDGTRGLLTAAHIGIIDDIVM
jgi:hypothetical protein